MKKTTVKPEDIQALIKAAMQAMAVISRALGSGLIRPETYVEEERAVIVHGTLKPVTVSEAIGQLVAAKKIANRSPRYINSLDHYLRQFSRRRENVPLAEITTDTVEKWLHKYPNAYSRQTWMNRLSTLFSFAVRREWIEKNPCHRIEKVSVDLKPPIVLTPAQAEMLVKTCDSSRREIDAAASLVPYVVLGIYAGVRPEETERLDWKAVNLETRTVKIDLAKTRRRRIVPLEPIAVKLLTPYVKPSGKICPSHQTIRRWRWRSIKLLGMDKWPGDILRHTAASYLLALHKDAGKVAHILGNSSSILLTHYHEVVTEADCKAFWQTEPPKHGAGALQNPS